MRYWLGVVSLTHTEVAVKGGFCQFNHGKQAPVERMYPGDRFVIYSPRQEMRAGEPVQAFTAIGEVSSTAYYQVKNDGFEPFRRDVRYFAAMHTPIRPLLESLTFTKGNLSAWGQALRRGFFEISESDFRLIASAMAVGFDTPD